MKASAIPSNIPGADQSIAFPLWRMTQAPSSWKVMQVSGLGAASRIASANGRLKQT